MQKATVKIISPEEKPKVSRDFKLKSTTRTAVVSVMVFMLGKTFTNRKLDIVPANTTCQVFQLMETTSKYSYLLLKKY